MRQFVNIDAAGGNVGRHQHANIAVLEALQGLRAGALAFVAMQCHALNAVFGQEFSDVVGAKFGARENQHLAPIVLLDDVGQQGLLFAATYRVNGLGDALYRGVARRDLNALWVLQQFCGKVTDLVAEGGREQQALLVLGHQRQDFLDVMNKAHVQHPVGFVQHQNLHQAQVQHALLLQVEQAARRGDQNVNAAAQLADLRAHAHAAKDHGGLQVKVFAVGAHGLFHLSRQLTGGCQHQGANADTAEFVLDTFAQAELVQHWQGEGSCLAGAGLGAAQQVLSGQHRRDGLGLDRRRCFIAVLEHGLQDGRCQVQFSEVHRKAPVRALGICLLRWVQHRASQWQIRFKGGTVSAGSCRKAPILGVSPANMLVSKPTGGSNAVNYCTAWVAGPIILVLRSSESTLFPQWPNTFSP